MLQSIYCNSKSLYGYITLRNISIFIFLGTLLKSEAHQWSQPYNAYLFAPGLWSSEHQAAKYCQNYGASTGQTIKAEHGFELINGDFTGACNFAEISPTKIDDLQEAQNSWWPQSLMKWAIYTIGKSILTKSNARYKISIEGSSTTGLTLNPYTLNLIGLNFGQLHDIKIISQEYDRLIKENPDKDVVLIGPSRGAAALMGFLALEYPKKSQKKVKGIILESCFDCLENLTILSYPIFLITEYEYKGISPIHPLIIKLFVTVCNAYNIPVLSVTSLKDQRVPAQNTYNLCTKLQDAGLRSLYCLTLKNSTHSAYLKDDPEDAYMYQATVHAFYKKYGLSHDPELAQTGLTFLEAAQ